MRKIEELIKKYQVSIERRELTLILAELIQQNTAFVLTHLEFQLNLLQLFKLKKIISGRKNNVPLAYLIGRKEFFGLDFFVNKHVLVPRPETELLVTEALKIIREDTTDTNEKLLIDVGTGSGCIPIAIAKNIAEKNTIYALDISRTSLRVAKKNAFNHQATIKFKRSNLLKYIIKQKIFEQYSTIIITANLPYLTETQFKNEPSIQHEPKNALVADDKGLALYKKMLLQVQEIFLKNTARNFYVLMEIDPDQTALLSQYITDTLPNWNTKIKTDLCSRDRLIITSNL
ncbi:MAG: HemK/PrmC family methyltransferase [bacterium]|nr:HemK/PrmC family methyltransferase [bacterium]